VTDAQHLGLSSTQAAVIRLAFLHSMPLLVKDDTGASVGGLCCRPGGMNSADADQAAVEPHPEQ
jgi:hypothetical protein